ncbi:MAG: hypothetical protein H7263_15300 [Candidatus Sericytochromatia bacterium]|nr:hypothetical protein [Candidatus Sericytochromatia bacterium]
MLHNESKTAKKQEISTVIKKNWVGLDSRANTKKYTNTNDSTLDYNLDYKLNFDSSNNSVDDVKYYNSKNIDNISTFNNSDLPIESHPNIEALAQCLIKKIDTLQDTQIDSKHIEQITLQAFQYYEKLRYEIEKTNIYVQKLEYKNNALETKIDSLISQNEAMIEHCTQIETMCQSFFSKNIQLENKILALSQQVYFLDDKENVLEFSSKNELEENNITDNIENTLQNTSHQKENYFIPESKYTHSSIIQDQRTVESINILADEKIDIKELIKSKSKVESFIKKNYPDDYRIIRQYDKKSLKSLVNKFLGLN